MTRQEKFLAIFYWSEADDAFIAEVPELPGCMADGASYKVLTVAAVFLPRLRWRGFQNA